jgi:hypothetical protein
MTLFNSSGQFILGGNILSLFLLFGSIHFWEVIFKEAMFFLWQSFYWNLFLELDISFWRSVFILLLIQIVFNLISQIEFKLQVLQDLE